MTVKIKGTLHKGSTNGLPSIARQLIREPLDQHVVVGVIETARIVHDFEGTDDSGLLYPVVRFVAIEPLTGPAADRARGLLEEAYRARTRTAPQPTLFASGRDDQRPTPYIVDVDDRE